MGINRKLETEKKRKGLKRKKVRETKCCKGRARKRK